MELNIRIHCGLERFIMIDRITRIDGATIHAEKTVSLNEAETFSGVEILAQTGAIHIRQHLDFRRHAFLLGIASYTGPSRVSPGLFRLYGVCESRSRNAYGYRLEGQNDGGITISGQFLFAVTDYGDDFQKNSLEQHYRKLFSCLTTGTEKNSIISA